MRIELSIKTTYLPDWRAQDGIREFIQNAKDAETEFNTPMKVWHNNHVLRIENKGAILPHEMLLLGYTTKADNPSLAGQWGEGAKISALVLTRLGHKVRIFSGSEIWKPILVKSVNFQADVLAFDISKGKDCGGVVVEVEGITYDEWLGMKKNFLFLMDKVESIGIPGYGDILLDPSMTGRIYVKGIFVQHSPKLMAGYNLLNAPTDRDRRVISSYELGWRLSVMWTRGASDHPELAEKLYEMLSSGKEDVDNISKYDVNSMTDDLKDRILRIFKRTFGDAIPVANIMESRDLEHMGRKGVVLPSKLAVVLQQIMGLEDGLETLRIQLSEEIITQHSWCDLSDTERQNLEDAISILEKAGEKIPMANLEIATIRSENVLGLWAKGRIVLSKAILTDRTKTLTVLIHEYAHHLSEKGDGDKSHVNHIERVWAAIFDSIRG